MADQTQYVTLGVADSLFAVPVAQVQEILEPQPLAKMPRAPADFLGVIDVRGQSVPVTDLRLRLAMPPAEDTLDTRIIVLEVAIDGTQRKVALRADRVFEVASLDGPLEPPARMGTRWQADGVAGVGRRNDAFVTVFDLDRLFSEESAPEPDVAA
ncbi:chemotaxis protein CheW [Aurantimonas sp. VKM B-3413]|uniref:chemotaxis protein CheW n=1 Tax=Aurantimonas sp. VKM B-3413 TaxID=2779401 RepID=UPI001E308222|nr:chemotaxis protein CheW [Aurantimonas sp. VKM B-3413]MCB8836452.1 chemotaxis protein CheW [Aurantimonas sp. VKM B-3413]